MPSYIKHLTLVLLPVLLFVGSVFPVVVVVPDEIELQSLFAKVDDIRADFSNDAAEYTALKETMQGAGLVLTNLEVKRQAVFNCLKDKFNMLVSQVQTCEENKAQVIADHAIEKASILSQIETLRQSTDAEIAALNETITNLNTQIENTNTAIGTFIDMKEPAVLEVLSDLAAARAQYQALLDSRLLFVEEINSLVNKVYAYNLLANEETAAIAELICAE